MKKLLTVIVFATLATGGSTASAQVPDEYRSLGPCPFWGLYATQWERRAENGGGNPFLSYFATCTSFHTTYPQYSYSDRSKMETECKKSGSGSGSGGGTGIPTENPA